MGLHIVLTEMENVTDAADATCVKYFEGGKILGRTYAIFVAKVQPW